MSPIVAFRSAKRLDIAERKPTFLLLRRFAANYNRGRDVNGYSKRMTPVRIPLRSTAFLFLVAIAHPAFAAPPYSVTEDDEQIAIETPELSAVVRKRGYVSGVAGGSFLDKRTGFRDVGYGLDIVDWIMEPGPDDDYRTMLPDHMVYEYGNPWHGQRPKRSIEGPQICTKAGEIESLIIRGDDFLAVKLWYDYKLAAPGKKTGSRWTQHLVFPAGKRYFLSSDRIDAANDSEAMFLRIDMPGHIKHTKGDTFSEVYLSYEPANEGRIAAGEFLNDFAPDERFNYRREDYSGPDLARMIRAYHLRDAKTGAAGPWLAGMTLDPAAVCEAWCHQRGYVCFIEEFGGRPVKAGESFGAAFVVGYFDSIEEMQTVYDRMKGKTAIAVDENGWRLE
jgi:hypothetical protein